MNQADIAGLRSAPCLAGVEDGSADLKTGIASVPAEKARDHRILSLDGLRGIAVLMVLVYHFTAFGFPPGFNRALIVLHNWGWAGVDLFFVLSGFLITGILHDSKESPHYFRNFYIRRSVRIFPAYFAFLALYLLILPAVSSTFFAARQELFAPKWSYWLYMSNYIFARAGQGDGALGHTWSLAIEEQFYLIWPLMVLAFDRRQMIQICSFLIAGGVAIRTVLLFKHASYYSIYYLTFTHADGLLIGAIVALMIRSVRGMEIIRHLCRWIAILSLVGLAATWEVKKKAPAIGTLLEESTLFLWLSLFFAAVLSIAVTTSPSTRSNRILASSPLRFFGRYSYGFYLYHLPLMIIVRNNFGDPHGAVGAVLRFVLLSAGTIGLGLISWNVIEKPILRIKDLFPMHSPIERKLATS